MKKKKLKFWCPIWKDPLGWSRWLGNNKVHLSIAILFHLIFCAVITAGIIAVKRLPDSETLDSLSSVIYSSMGIHLFVVGFFIPASYLYAIYRLIKIIDKKEEKNIEEDNV